MYSRGLKLIIIILTLAFPLMAPKPVSADQISLVITQAIPSIPSDGRSHPAFFITLQDSAGKPHPLPYSLNITISCSDERILKVQSWAIINAAAYYVVINATSDVIERKTVEVTVSASGFKSSKINANIVPPAGTPQALKVTILPNVLMTLDYKEAIVIVTVVDSYGNPAKARSDLNVALSSSNLQIADVQFKTIIIPEDSISAQTRVTSRGLPGSSTITASVSNLKPDSATISVIGPKPERIYIWSPSCHLKNEPGYVFVAITDSSLKPVKLVSPMTIQLYSSDPGIFTVQNSVTIGVGEWTATAALTCRAVGATTIYASAGNLASTSLTLRSVDHGGAAYALKLYSMASSFPADEREYTAMIVQVVDRSGIPTKLNNTARIDLFSSNEAIFKTTPYVNILYGSSKADVTATPKLLGNVKVSAVSSGLIASEASVSVYVPTPSSISILAPPVPSDGEVDACLITTSGGNPAAVLQDTQIFLASSNTGVGDAVGSVILYKKQYFTYFKISGKSPGQFSLTASGSGLPTAKVSISVLEVKPSTFSLSYVKPIVNYDFPMVIQFASKQGSSAVAYEPVTINLASSNASNVQLPATTTIQPENTEVLLFGKALTKDVTVLTLSSQGFNSLVAQITPAPINIVLQIIAKGSYPIGQKVNIKTSVILEGTPVKGIAVYWNGTGLLYSSTETNEDGMAENTLTVQEKENKIVAAINIGGTGYLSTSKTILGVLGMYILEVSSNVPVDIDGSGSYSYNERVQLVAPSSVRMPGIMGLLGGKYYFKQWTGAIDSTSNTATLTISGDKKDLYVNALYVEDYFLAMLSIVGIAILASVAVFVLVYLIRIRGKEPAKQEKPTS